MTHSKPVPGKVACLHPSHSMILGPSCPSSLLVTSQKLTGLWSRLQHTWSHTWLNADGPEGPAFSFEGDSLTPSLTLPSTFSVTQQLYFIEILREVHFSQNEPQASHSSTHQYCSLWGRALVSVLALNKLAEIPEFVRTARAFHRLTPFPQVDKLA